MSRSDPKEHSGGPVIPNNRNEIRAMTSIQFSITVEIPAPPPLVCSVTADVERWPEWTASISGVKRLSPPLSQHECRKDLEEWPESPSLQGSQGCISNVACLGCIELIHGETRSSRKKRLASEIGIGTVR